MAENISEYELLRQKNIEENIQKMKELGIFFNDNLDRYEEKPKPRRRRTFGGLKLIPTEKRRSKRLATQRMSQCPYEAARQILNESMVIVMEDGTEYGGDENSFIVDNDIKDKKKPRRKHQMVGDRKLLSVDKITEDDLKRIAERVCDKCYSQDGTTCHQCRQKTEDQKTICRSSQCFGVRGQFCGPCLKNRYGESVATALKDPEWTCPPCRNTCNCSICRKHAGKIPTGQLAFLAQQRGYESVKHLLEAENEN